MDKKIKILWVAVVIAMVIAIIGIFTSQGGKVTNTITERLGGITNFNSLTLSDNLVVDGTSAHTGIATFTVSPVFTSGIDKLIQGGGVNATTTGSISATSTLQLADLRDYNYFEVVNMNTTGLAVEWKFPATSTMITLLPTIGDWRTWAFHNATSTSLDLSFTAGTGMDLVAEDAAYDYIDAGDWAYVTCMQITYRGVDNENIVCAISEQGNAD